MLYKNGYVIVVRIRLTTLPVKVALTPTGCTNSFSRIQHIYASELMVMSSTLFFSGSDTICIWWLRECLRDKIVGISFMRHHLVVYVRYTIPSEGGKHIPFRSKLVYPARQCFHSITSKRPIIDIFITPDPSLVGSTLGLCSAWSRHLPLLRHFPSQALSKWRSSVLSFLEPRYLFVLYCRDRRSGWVGHVIGFCGWYSVVT